MTVIDLGWCFLAGRFVQKTFLERFAQNEGHKKKTRRSHEKGPNTVFSKWMRATKKPQAKTSQLAGRFGCFLYFSARGGRGGRGQEGGEGRPFLIETCQKGGGLSGEGWGGEGPGGCLWGIPGGMAKYFFGAELHQEKHYDNRKSSELLCVFTMPPICRIPSLPQLQQ